MAVPAGAEQAEEEVAAASIPSMEEEAATEVTAAGVELVQAGILVLELQDPEAPLEVPAEEEAAAAMMGSQAKRHQTYSSTETPHRQEEREAVATGTTTVRQAAAGVADMALMEATEAMLTESCLAGAGAAAELKEDMEEPEDTAQSVDGMEADMEAVAEVELLGAWPPVAGVEQEDLEH